MDKDRVCQIIDWAIDQGVKPYELLPQMNPHAFHIKNLVNSSVQAPDNILDQVVQALKEEQELDRISFGYMNVPSIGLPLRLRPIAEWLLAQALAHGSEVAFDLLQRFVDKDYPATLEVCALCGFTTYEEIKLPLNILLVPFSSLPQSEASDFFKQTPSWYSRDRAFRRLPEPGAALVIRNSNGITLGSDAQASQQIHDGLFRKVALCLTLFGPSAPTPVAYWCQIEDWDRVPSGGELGSGALYLEEIIPDKMFPASSPSAAGINVYELVDRYLGLDVGTQKKLELPLQRLNLALKRQSNVDSAIELRVALESLLVDNPKGISAQIRERGSRLGSTDPAERIKLTQILKNVYSLCSRAIHSGMLSDQDDSALLREGISICANLIRAIIYQGSVPDWNTLL
jgi:hypothetical protein